MAWARPGALEWGGVLMLGLGSYLLPIIGTIAGLLMVALSPWWTTRQKVVAAAISLSSAVIVPLVGLSLFMVADSSIQQHPAPIVQFETAPPAPSLSPNS